MLRKALINGLVLSLGLVGTLVPVRAAVFFTNEPPAMAGAPYSGVATIQSTTLFSDGTHIVRNSTVRFARDSQGRTRTERSVGPVLGESAAQSNPTIIMINDPVGSQRLVINPQLKTVNVIKTGNGAVPPSISNSDAEPPFALMGLGMSIGAAPATESSSNTTSLGQKTINGLTATGSREVRTIPSGVLGNDKAITSTLDKWMSPDLGVPVQVTETSSIGGQVTLNLTDVVRSEPDPSLFTAPSGYTRHEFTGPNAAVAAMALAQGGVAAMHAVGTVTAVKSP